MAFDPSVYPFLTPYSISEISDYGTPFASAVTGSSIYNTSVSWSGPGGNLEIQTSGNLEQIAALNTTGLIGIVIPGVEVAAIQLTGGNGISSVLTGNDFVISVVPSTTVQWINGQSNSIGFGTPRDTINLIPGRGIGMTTEDDGFVLSWTISADAGAGQTAPFVIYTADDTLTSAQNIGLLTTGLLKNTVTSESGTLSTAIAGTDYLAPNDNLTAIGDLSPVNGDILAFYGDAWNLLAPGSIGDVLTVISSTSIGYAAASGGGDVYLAGAQTFTGIKTFTPKTIFTNSVQIPLGASSGYILTSDVSGNATWAAASGGGDVFLAGAQTFTGIKTFTPKTLFTNSVQIALGATDGYVLTSDASGNATWAAATGGDVFLAGAQTFTGIKTFTPQTIFTNSVQIPLGAVSGKVLSSDGSGNATWQFLNLTTLDPIIIGVSGAATKVAIATGAGISQGNAAIAIGSNAGHAGQLASAVAIGISSGALNQGTNSIAVGNSAGNDTQGVNSVAVGIIAGERNQGDGAVAIGLLAGQVNQGAGAVSLGQSAGQNSQGANAIAIGTSAAPTSQVANSIVLNASGSALETAAAGFYVSAVRSAAGTTPVAMAFDTTTKEVIAWTGAPVGGGDVYLAGAQTFTGIKTFTPKTIFTNSVQIPLGASSGYILTSDVSGNATWAAAGSPSLVALNPILIGTSGGSEVAIGNGSGVSQGAQSVAIGAGAGASTQGVFSIAVGPGAGGSHQGNDAIAIGEGAGATNQTANGVAIGRQAGMTSQAAEAIAIGNTAGTSAQGAACLAIGPLAGTSSQGQRAVALGSLAGSTSQGAFSVAIGKSAAETSQGTLSVAIGNAAASNNQQTSAVAIGYGAAPLNQGSYAVAIGANAGGDNQGSLSVAIGQVAGWGSATGAVAIGYSAGAGNTTPQGTQAIAIGSLAAPQSQVAHSIVVDASGTGLINPGVAGLFINPIRTTTGATPVVMAYDTTSKEVIAWSSAPLPTTSTVITTDDVTNTSLYSVAIPSGGYVTINGTVNAGSDDFTDVTGGSVVVTAINTSGTPAIVGSPFVVVNASSTAIFTAVINGSNLEIQVNGLAATTYNWSFNGTVMIS